MASVRTIRSSFNAGELTPELFGNVGLDKLQSGLALCRNFVALPHGPVQNRAGFAYVNSVKTATKRTRLIPFSFNNQQTFALELGAGYFRFHAQGETLVISGAAELLTNNRFTADVSGWTDSSAAGSHIAWDAGNYGQMQLVSGPSSQASTYQAITTVPGQVYVIGVAISAVSGTSHSVLRVGSTAGAHDLLDATTFNSAVPGQTYDANPAGWFTFTATGTTAYVSVMNAAFGSTLNMPVMVCGLLNKYVCQWAKLTSYAAGVLTCDGAGNVYYALQAVPAGTVLSDTAHWLPMTFYELPNPYAEADLFDIHYVQSGDVLTLVHPDYAPMELRRYGDWHWVLAAIEFVSSLSAPLLGTVSAHGGSGGSSGSQTLAYVVTALDSYGQQESLASAAGSVVNDLTGNGAYNQVNWSAGSGGGAVAYFNVYKSINGGASGFIGQVPAGTLSFKDNNITPDWTQSPPLNDSAMANVGDYPGAVGYYEQRRVFAGSDNQPQNVWATQSGTESNMNYSLPSQASDALRFRIAALRASVIGHVVALWDLLLLTASTVWRVYTASGDALAPSTITIKAQSQVGASNVQPVVVNQAAIYAASQGGHVRELSYQWQIQGYQDRDLCLLARHLFDGLAVVELAFSRSLYPIVWAVSADGRLLGLTYLPDQEVFAWHQHTTQGMFESVCVVQEGNFDVVYGVVNRTIAGVQNRYVERLDTRQYGADLTQAFFVDCGATYTAVGSGTVTSVSGLNWLAGATVSVLLDGKPYTGLTVSSSGVLTLPVAAHVVQVGLAIDAQFQTPPLVLTGDSSAGQGRVKCINKVWARVVDFVGCAVGPGAAQLVAVAPQVYQADGVTPQLWAGEWRVNILPQFSPDGGVVFSQPQPLPLTVCDLSMEVAIGG